MQSTTPPHTAAIGGSSDYLHIVLTQLLEQGGESWTMQQIVAAILLSTGTEIDFWHRLCVDWVLRRQAHIESDIATMIYTQYSLRRSSNRVSTSCKLQEISPIVAMCRDLRAVTQ